MKKTPAGNTQYTKLGFSGLFKGCGSHQRQCILIVNRPQSATFHTANVGGNNDKKNNAKKLMMKRLIYIAIGLTSFLNLNGQNLELEISSNKSTFEIGEEIYLKLTLTDLTGEMTETNNDSLFILDLKSFKKEMVVIINKQGNHKLGPYVIDLKDKKIQSNIVFVNIEKPNKIIENSDTLISLIVPEKVNKNKDFTITLKSNYNLSPLMEIRDLDINDDWSKIKIKQLNFVEDRNFKQISFSFSNSTTIENNITKAEFVYDFVIKAKQKGVFKISNISFSPILPNFSEKKIIVE